MGDTTDRTAHITVEAEHRCAYAYQLHARFTDVKSCSFLSHTSLAVP